MPIQPNITQDDTSALPAFYEQQLDRDPRWAMSERGRHFEESSAVFKSLRQIAARLRSIGIPYAVVGGMAMFQHGLRRITEDVELLVTRSREANGIWLRATLPK